MNVYEDKYLCEKVSRIIARQREGRIVIASYKDGSGLPDREDFGIAITRASHPYDYAVGEVGFLNYDSALGAYLFNPREGAKLPPALTKYKTLTLAKATLDISRRLLQIQSGENLVTFTGVQPWKGLHCTRCWMRSTTN